jgi:riboflavin transporter FmnP
MDKLVALFLGAIGLLGAMVFLSFLLSFPVYLLWNGCLIGAVSGVHEITWTQAWGINILCGFLFQSSVSTKN